MRLWVLLLLTPLLIAGGGDPPIQQHVAELPEPSTNWTMIIVAFLGMLGACVPAYLGYRAHKRRK